MVHSTLKGNSNRTIVDWYREAVASYSPGLLQPWVSRPGLSSTMKGLRPADATIFAIESSILSRYPGAVAAGIDHPVNGPASRSAWPSRVPLLTPEALQC
jgi:hypothetical protein